MAPGKLTSLIQKLSQIIIDAPNERPKSERNEEWTKMVLIVPLIEGLGWIKLGTSALKAAQLKLRGGWILF